MSVTYRPDAYYLCFTLDTDENAAAARYQHKFGKPPEQVLEHAGLLRLGPVEDEFARVVVSTIDNTL